ncbi:MAG: hypothetical protein KDC84_08285 [Crocinitomicaceae bacterium]|nr:hypothetical protein [Crocinitomicaceae bacterium]
MTFKSINDIKDFAYADYDLPESELLAMVAFDKFRIRYLSESTSEEDFERRYMELRIMANNMSYEEFLKEKYLKR